jgi:hypothetical protein
VHYEWMDCICSKDVFLRQITSIIILSCDGRLFFSLVPRTEPIMMPPMHRRMKRQVGKANLFLRYHGRSLNAIQTQVKNIDNEI